MRLYFVRHCESEANVQQIWWNEPVGYGLTERGREQAGVLVELFAGVEFAALYCSPVLRAVQTAEIVGQRLGLTPQIEDALRERDVGILQGQEISRENRSLCYRITRQWMVHGNREVRFEGGESYTDIAARFLPFICKLEARYRDAETNVLLISHGQTLALMLPRLLSNVDWAYSSTHTFDGTVHMVAELRGDEWVCLRWGEETMMV